MGILNKLFGWLKSRKQTMTERETTRRLQASGVSQAPYPPGVTPGLQSDTKAEVKEKHETCERLRDDSIKMHQAVRAKLSRM